MTSSLTRMLFTILLTLALLIFSRVQAQYLDKGGPRIGVLLSEVPATFGSRDQAFREGLHELGYRPGSNIHIEYRYAEGKLGRLPELATELLRRKVDVFLVGGASAALAAKQATSTIPIVIGGAGDLVGAGLIASLAKPGGNITGSTLIAPDLSGKRLEVLKEVVPREKGITYGCALGPSPSQSNEVKATEAAADDLGVKVQAVEVKDAKDFDSAYTAIKGQAADAIIIIQSSFSLAYRKQLAELATKHRLPSCAIKKSGRMTAVL